MKIIKHDNGNIEISEEDFNDLIKDQKFLQALEEAGVDNWDGYDEAYRNWYINKDHDQ